MKKIFKKIMAVVSVSAMLLSLLPTVSMAAMKPDFNAQKRVIYIDDLGVFASVGANGVHTSKDGINWTKRHNASAYGYSGTDIAWGGPEGSELLLVICGQNRVFTTYDLNESGSANTSTIVWHDVEDGEGNVTQDWNYLRTYPQLIWDEYSEKFYVSGVEYAKDNTTIVDYGLYCSDGVKKFNRNLGAAYNRYMEWEKVDLGEADFYAQYDSDADGVADARFLQDDATILWPNIATDNQGRIAMTTRSTNSAKTNAAGIAPRNSVVNIKIGEDKEIEKVVAFITNVTYPKATIDGSGNVILAGTYGGSPFTKPIVTSYDFDDAFELFAGADYANTDDFYSYVCTSSSAYGPGGVAYNYNAKWAFDEATETWTKKGAMTGSLSSNTGKQRLFVSGMGKEGPIFDVAMGADGQPFVFIAPQKGKATIDAGYHNDFAMIPYVEDTETGAVSLSTKYYTLINNDATLKSLIGNGGTAQTVVDTAVSPAGKMVVMTTKDCFVIDTEKIDTQDFEVTDRSSAVLNTGHKIQNDASSIEIDIDKTKISAGEVSNIAVTSYGLGEKADGGETAVVVDTEYTFEIVNDEADYAEGLEIDLAGKKITAKSNVAGVYPVTLRATSKSNPSTFAEVTFDMTVCETIIPDDEYDIGFEGFYIGETEIKNPYYLIGSQTITAKINYINTTSEDESFVYVIGYYDENGSVIAVDFDKSVYTVKESEVVEKNIEFTLPEDVSDISCMKVYAWESIASLRPICESYAIYDSKWKASGVLPEKEVLNLVTSFCDDGGRGFAWSTENEEYTDMATRYAKADAEWYGESMLEEAEFTEYAGRLYYKADIKNLEPGESYVYKIGDIQDDVWSDFYTFTTEPENLTEFSFIAVTDPQSSSWSGFELYQKTLDKAFGDAPEAAFLVNAGDMVSDGTSQAQWDDYFLASSGYIERVPHVAVMGNHETRGDENTAGKHFSLQFNNPSNGADALGSLTSVDVSSVYTKGIINNFEETVYSFDYGDAHIVVLNSGTDWSESGKIQMMTEEAKWLDKDLEATDKKWKIVVAHMAMYPAKTERYNLCEELTEVIDKHNVDLMLSGHDHMVTRTYPMRAKEIAETQNSASISKGTGLINAILGSAGRKRYDEVTEVPSYLAFLQTTSSGQPTYSILNVSDDKISVITKQIDGMVIDSFEIIDVD